MARVPRDRDLKRLEQELRSHEYQNLLARLQRGEPFLRQFPTWGDVVIFMRRGTSRDPRKDEILRPILVAHSGDPDHRWRTILLVIFWPGLRSIHRKKSSWDRNNPDELWQRIFWAFHQSVCRIDLEHRHDRLAQWLFNSTVHRLYEEYHRDWRRTEREIGLDPVEDEERFGAGGGIDLVAIDLGRAQEKEIRRFRAHRQAGRISEADFLLLVGTRVYGASLSDYTREKGLSYQTAKKRRQRAEAAIRLVEEEER